MTLITGIVQYYNLSAFSNTLRSHGYSTLVSWETFQSVCQDKFSLSIRRFWGKRGKMEAKKGESCSLIKNLVSPIPLGRPDTQAKTSWTYWYDLVMVKKLSADNKPRKFKVSKLDVASIYRKLLAWIPECFDRLILLSTKWSKEVSALESKSGEETRRSHIELSFHFQ